jgi:hypothetical protein
LYFQTKWLDYHGWRGYVKMSFYANPSVLSKLTKQEVPMGMLVTQACFDCKDCAKISIEKRNIA